MNHFNLFNLPTSYSLDLKTLDQQYFALQVKYHPDKTQRKEEQQEFLRKAIDINEGYQILKNDYARAVYLLRLQQIDVENEAENYPLPSEILERIWDDRTELEETHDVTKFLSDKVKAREGLLLELGKAFDMQYYESAAISTLKLRYLDNLINSAKAKQQNAVH